MMILSGYQLYAVFAGKKHFLAQAILVVHYTCSTTYFVHCFFLNPVYMTENLKLLLHLLFTKHVSNYTVTKFFKIVFKACEDAINFENEVVDDCRVTLLDVRTSTGNIINLFCFVFKIWLNFLFHGKQVSDFMAMGYRTIS